VYGGSDGKADGFVDAASEGYRHWKLKVDGRVATLLMDVNEDAGLRSGYRAES